MRPNLCVAAMGVVHDSATNNVSLFNILEELRPAGFPLFVQQIGVLAMWEREAGDPEHIDLTFVLRNNDQQLAELPVAVAFGVARRHRTLLGLGGIVVQQPGELVAEFRRDGAVVASYIVHVVAPAAAAVNAGGG